jgi:uncharacterized membrane protein
VTSPRGSKIDSDPDDIRWHRSLDRTKDAVLLIVGVIGIINELFIQSAPRPEVLVFLGALLGLPFVTAAARKGP